MIRLVLAALTAIPAVPLLGCSLLHGEVPAPTMNASSLYDFTVKDIKGKDAKLSKYKGKVVLVVNVASKCGLTPQYEALEKLYRANKDKGFVILGFPANNFMGQEPGTNEEIQQFCKSKYDVSFPMFSKVSVKGDDTVELYRWLIASSDRPKDEIEWNFGKFLVGKDGKVIKRFAPQTKPDSEEITKAIAEAIG